MRNNLSDLGTSPDSLQTYLHKNPLQRQLANIPFILLLLCKFLQSSYHGY